MILSVGKSSSATMSDPSILDPGPFTCPVCRRISFSHENAIHGWCDGCKAATGIPFKGPGTKILVVGDTGGDLEWLADRVISYATATGCTMIMQLGGFGFVWHEEVAGRNLDDIHELLTEAGLALTFLPGNYENHPLLERLASEADKNADGHAMLRPTIAYAGRVSAWTWDGLRMAAVGGGASIDRDMRVVGKSWWPEEMLRPDEAEAASQLGPVDILFSHDAPIGVPLRLIPDVASTVHRTYMTQIGNALVPAWWFHGHYHDSLFYKFRHAAGETTVRGLDCNHAQYRVDAMVPINLRAIRQGLDVTRYTPEA